ncbi:hypothetical protein GGTG_01690 [Gaeumannomyces tritici R3-111a-1]|uniref:WSC domain-containing protein n=1 Tax=Gaeumannomyces tritici (strain R3-111a-1) TaxID=644352 RepID=J3NKB0_GAET3|nr:hypothetical protein GGTG_01690 [Gaeumannomyces tritici R3-111a-1]EJT81714.1 hypothetical protein GGTG_01690 [Gaeumannomyces tritici R3-111a-1]
MSSLRSLVAAAAVVSYAGQTYAWTVALPPCLSAFQPFVYSGCYNDVKKPDTLSFKSPLSRENMTVEMCVADCKGNGYRYAGLEYYGDCYCGASVNGPEATEAECNLPCTGNKNQTCGGNDRISIWQDPTFKHINETNIEHFKNIGCYTSNANGGKTLAYPVQDVTGQTWDESTATTSKCLAACKSKGFPFAGTEYGQECWCGVVMGNGTVPADASECNMPCKGDAKENCGGSSRVNIWVSDDLESLEPCGYTPPSSSTSSTTTWPSTSSSVISTSSTSSAMVSTSTSSSSSSTTSTKASTSSSSTSSTSCTTSTTTKATTSSSSTQKTSSTSCTTTSKPPVTTKPPTTTQPPTTKPPTHTPTTSSAVCVTTVVTTPKCEYKCGNWCSGELPNWENQNDCKSASSNCKLQVAACFKQAGWPGAAECFGFQQWCDSCDKYCKQPPKNKCSKGDWFNQKPPVKGPSGKPTTKTITVPCKPTTTSKPPHTTSMPTKPTTTTKPSMPNTTYKCPVPTVTNICKQPTSWKDNYGPGNPVGGIELPVVTCNDIKREHQSGKQWKLYTDSDSSKCPGYSHGGVPNACQDACKEQYDDCVKVYAEGCKAKDSNKGGWGGSPNGWPWKRSIAGRTVSFPDSWSTANNKCRSQYNDCLAVNKGVNSGGKCSSWGQGW